MKSIHIIGIGLMSAFMLSPIIVSAQDSTGTASAEVTTTKASTTPNGRNLLSPRDSASGQATGKRVNASGTRPLSEKIENQMERRDEAMERKASTTSARQGEAMERIAEKRSEILKRISTQMILRMNAAIERYTTLANRLDSRVAKLKEKGVDTSKAEANIVIARAKIADAKIAVTLAENNIAQATVLADATSTKPVDAGKSVRDSLQSARTAIVASHKALVDAISSLRANIKVNATATTTVATTTATTPAP